MALPRRQSLHALDIAPRHGSSYPPPLDGTVRGRAKRALGEPFGLDQFGVNLTDIAPGAASALRHWHSAEDELVFVLDGELTLITDAGEEVLRAGDVIGFKAGRADGHHLVNRSGRPARVIEIGSRRLAEDHVTYPDDDLAVVPDPTGRRRFLRRDGTPV